MESAIKSPTREPDTKSKPVDDDDGPMITGGRDDGVNRLPSKELCQEYLDFFTRRSLEPTVDPDEEIPFKVD